MGLTFALLLLAAYRLTTLVTTDTITRPIRRRAAKRWPPTVEHVGDAERLVPSWPVELLSCGRCIGWWASGAVSAAAWAGGIADGGRWFAVSWLACAGAVSLLVALAP